MYPNLRAEMARSRVTNEMIAKMLGINPATVSAKLNTKDRLKLCEARKIHDELFPKTDFIQLFTVAENEDENKAS